MIAWLAHSAWVERGVPASVPTRYYVDPSVCPTVLAHIAVDTALSWHAPTCADVHTEVRDAFDAWQHNSDLAIHEVRSARGADLVVGTADLGDAFAGRITLARYMPNASRGAARIDLDRSACW
jgi:hypothetical protein